MTDVFARLPQVMSLFAQVEHLLREAGIDPNRGDEEAGLRFETTVRTVWAPGAKGSFSIEKSIRRSGCRLSWSIDVEPGDPDSSVNVCYVTDDEEDPIDLYLYPEALTSERANTGTINFDHSPERVVYFEKSPPLLEPLLALNPSRETAVHVPLTQALSMVPVLVKFFLSPE